MRRCAESFWPAASRSVLIIGLRRVLQIESAIAKTESKAESAVEALKAASDAVRTLNP